MRIKLVNKDSLVVDCHAAMKDGRRWTLIDNETGERTDFRTAGGIASYLRDNAGVGAQEDVEGPKYKTWAFFVDRDAAPSLLNLLDASDHAIEWKVRKLGNDTLDSRIVRIDYKSDRQLLFQEDGNAVFRDPVDDGKETNTAAE